MKVSSYSGLRAAVVKAMVSSMDEIKEEAKDIVKKNIDTEVYGAGSPDEYARTYAFRESTQATIKGGGGSSVFAEIKSDGGGGHYSIVNGAVVDGYIDKIIHDGKAGLIFGSGFWTARRPYMDKAKEEIKGKYRGMAVKALRNSGLNVR